MAQFQVIEVNGVQVNVSSLEQSLCEVKSLIGSGARHYVCFFEGNMLHWAYSRPEIREILNGASLCYPDGVAVAKLASWRLGCPVARVSGPTFILKACEYGVSRGWRHYFFGGKEGVAEELARTLQERFPGLQVAGTACPPFRDMTEQELADLIAELSAKKVDLLWVALGGPRQEQWMHKYLGRMPVPVMLGVGAAFDFHTGHQVWCPKWLRVLGLEWLWRMMTGGRRVMIRNLICVTHVALRLLLSACGRVKYIFVRHSAAAPKVPAGCAAQGAEEARSNV